MQSPFDNSTLNEIQDNIYQDKAGGLLIINPHAVKKQYEKMVQSLNTEEVQLANLGVFPLAKASLALLARTLTYDKKELTIEPLLQKSQIPLYSTKDRQIVYIPPEGLAICRYFHELWATETNAESENEIDTALSGFTLLASFAGI